MEWRIVFTPKKEKVIPNQYSQTGKQNPNETKLCLFKWENLSPLFFRRAQKRTQRAVSSSSIVAHFDLCLQKEQVEQWVATDYMWKEGTLKNECFCWYLLQWQWIKYRKPDINYRQFTCDNTCICSSVFIFHLGEVFQAIIAHLYLRVLTATCLKRCRKAWECLFLLSLFAFLPSVSSIHCSTSLPITTQPLWIFNHSSSFSALHIPSLIPMLFLLSCHTPFFFCHCTHLSCSISCWTCCKLFLPFILSVCLSLSLF